MRIAIRVDSSTVIGSGHLIRCLTLAEQMRKEKNAEVHFISRDLDGNLFSKIKTAGFSLHILPRHPLVEKLTGYVAWLTVPQDTDAEETKRILREFGKVDCLVVDNYALDLNWEREMRPFVDEIFVIDDLANRKHDCDILLDQNFYLDKEKRYLGLVPEKCKLLLGPRHALLREEFYQARKHLRKRDGNLRSILVFYGGSDVTNETMKALRALCVFHETKPEVTVDVIVGASNPHKKEIKVFCASSIAAGWMRYHFQVDNMAEMMACADLMLGAGGATTWERCFLELPSVVTSVAKNQEKICVDGGQAGLFIYLGRADSVGIEDLVVAVQGMNDCFYAKNGCLELREFIEKDIEDTYWWVKNPIHKKLFLTHRMETVESNRDYWHKQLSISRKKMVDYAIYVQEIHIGNCGFRDMNNRQAVLWLYLGYPFWHRGWGGMALGKLLQKGFCELDLEVIRLHVAMVNIPAQKIYRRAGFMNIDEEMDVKCENREAIVMQLTKKGYRALISR